MALNTWLDESYPWLVVGRKTAKQLWTQAAEIRALTALDSKTKAAKYQSLRKVELIPKETPKRRE